MAKAFGAWCLVFGTRYLVSGLSGIAKTPGAEYQTSTIKYQVPPLPIANCHLLLQPRRHRPAVFGFHGVEFLRFAFGNAQRLPLGFANQFGDVKNLADVVSVVGDLAVDCLHDRVGVTPDIYRSRNVFGLQRVESLEGDLPAVVPPAHDLLTGGAGFQFKFLVAAAIWFLSVTGQKIPEAGALVAAHMLYDQGDAVRRRVGRVKEVRILQLRKSAFGQALVPAEAAAGFVIIGGGNGLIFGHEVSSGSFYGFSVAIRQKDGTVIRPRRSMGRSGLVLKSKPETQRDEAATKTPHRRDRRGRRDTQEKQRQGMGFRPEIVASHKDFHG